MAQRARDLAGCPPQRRGMGGDQLQELLIGVVAQRAVAPVDPGVRQEGVPSTLAALGADGLLDHVEDDALHP